MNTFETSLTPAQALRELQAQQKILEYAIALLDYADNVPEIKDAKTMFGNWFLQSEFLLGELSPLLCLATINPHTTLQTSPRTLPNGTQELPSLSEFPLPLLIAS
jgi:hypothetical protein